MAYPAEVITRYAPTPSGFLHLGNLVNFALTARVARKEHADILLRIDDVDTERIRQVYVDDVFDALAWLDLTWTIGPRSVDEVAQWSQRGRRSEHWQAAEALRDLGKAYVCECTRAQWSDYDGPECPRGCSSRSLTLTPGTSALRFDSPGFRHVVLWRREDQPSYHLASLVDDDHFGIDLVVRGADLEPSTEIQRALSRELPGSRFHSTNVVHHPILTDSHGAKLSKSAGSSAHRMPRTDLMRDQIQEHVDQMVAAMSADRPRSPGN